VFGRRICDVNDLFCLDNTLQVAYFSSLNRWRLNMKLCECRRRVMQRDTPEHVALTLQHGPESCLANRVAFSNKV